MAADREEQPAPARPSRFKLLAVRLAQLATLTCAGLWLLAWLAGWFRVCELLTHFQAQYLMVFGLGALVFGLWRCWRDLAFAAVFLLLAGWQVLPWYLPAEQPNGPTIAELKIVSANVHKGNHNFQPLLDLARDEDPDLLVLLEVDGRWLEACEPLRERFPFRISDARNDNFGLAVFSKLPLRRIPVQLGWIPSIVVEVPLGSQRVSVVCTHPMPPMSDQMYEQRNQQLQAIARWIAKRQRPAVVAGDLNITMWSPNYRALEAEAGLANARRGFGVVPTYHTSIGPAAIPIDHILHTHQWRVREFYRAPNIDSDHWPVVGVLELVE